VSRAARAAAGHFFNPPGDTFMQWTTPTFEDLRFGFEITMYIASR
jgi:coenzyme PQQ precursor peptide PqqA